MLGPEALRAALLRRRRDATTGCCSSTWAATSHLDPPPEPLLAPPEGGGWTLLWSSEDPRYGGGGTPELDAGHAAGSCPATRPLVLSAGDAMTRRDPPHRVARPRRGRTRTRLGTREWLVTNGLGGYASGTVSALVTRRYHGLLIAALPRRSAGR